VEHDVRAVRLDVIEYEARGAAELVKQETIPGILHPGIQVFT
jgi:hypothetical protein